VLAANIGMVWGEIGQSVWMVVIITLCIAGLVFIGFMEWNTIRKRRKTQ